jgi:hypothetical protein
MPQEPFLIKDEIISFFEVSANMSSQETNFKYPNKYLVTDEDTETIVDPEEVIPFDKDFFSDSSVYFIGSHNSFYLKDSG